MDRIHDRPTVIPMHIKSTDDSSHFEEFMDVDLQLPCHVMDGTSDKHLRDF